MANTPSVALEARSVPTPGPKRLASTVRAMPNIALPEMRHGLSRREWNEQVDVWASSQFAPLQMDPTNTSLDFEGAVPEARYTTQHWMHMWEESWGGHMQDMKAEHDRMQQTRCVAKEE